MSKEVMDEEMYNEGDGEVVAWTLGVDRLGTGARSLSSECSLLIHRIGHTDIYEPN